MPTEETQSPDCPASNNHIAGPFNKMTIVANSNGAIVLENTLGVIFLGLVAILLVLEVARLGDENRRLRGASKA